MLSMLPFLQHIRLSLDEEIFVRLTLSHPVNKDNEIKKIIVRLIRIKEQDHLSFTLRYSTKDITKNFSVIDGISEVQTHLEHTFLHARLFTIVKDFLFEKKKNKILIRENPPEFTEIPERTHNRQKEHAVAPEKKDFLKHLGVTDSMGKVRPKSQDKFRQINQYISLLKPKLQLLTNKNEITVADMGSGKGYLTFALFDYLKNNFNTEIRMTGVEMREDMVNFCNSVAEKCQMNGLNFKQSTIEQYPLHKINILVALHACNTATDEALAKGIQAGASVIVVAPCCHHQIRNEIESSAMNHPLEFITRHGIFLERMSEMITDAMRVMYLEYSDYKVSVCEFIADAHTHKNIMIIAEKQQTSISRKESIVSEIKQIQLTYGIKEHALEKLLKLSF
jgi:hypothetical protein